MQDLDTFHQFVKSGDLSEVRRLLDQNPALLNEANAQGQVAFLLAKYYGQQAIAEELVFRGAELDIFSLAVADDTHRLQRALEAEPSMLRAHSKDGWTLLHLAAFFGSRDVAELLLHHGAEVDALSTNAMQNTPLHAATAGRHPELAALLVARGANVNARQHGGWTALHSAAQNGDRQLVELFLAHGAAVNARADNGQVPLDLALQRGHGEIAELLEATSARLN